MRSEKEKMVAGVWFSVRTSTIAHKKVHPCSSHDRSSPDPQQCHLIHARQPAHAGTTLKLDGYSPPTTNARLSNPKHTTKLV
jgi:hypothetical protein